MIGQTISHYRVLEAGRRRHGAGLSEPRDLRLGRRVALKFLPDDLEKDPQALERFSARPAPPRH